MEAASAPALCTQCAIFPQSARRGVTHGLCCNRCPEHGPWCTSHHASEELIGSRRASCLKRSALEQATSAEPPTKALRFTNSKLCLSPLVLQAVKSAQNVPEAVCEMLCTALRTCCTNAGDFHPFQKRVLLMAHQTLRKTRDAEACRVQALKGSLAVATKELESELHKIDEMRRNAKAAVLLSCVDVGTKEDAFTKSVAALSNHKVALAKAERELKVAVHEISAAASDREHLQERITLRQELQQEAPDSENDALIGELSERLAGLDKTIAERSRARKLLALKFQVGKDWLGAANDEQELCAQALAQAQSTLQERSVAVKAKSEPLEQQKAIVAKISKDLQVAESRLEAFELGPCAAFIEMVLAMEDRHAVYILSGNEKKELAASLFHDDCHSLAGA